MTRRCFISTARLIAYCAELDAEGIDYTVTRSPISCAHVVNVNL